MDSEEIDKALAVYFIGCTILFSIIESDHFRNFIHKLNPAYKIPTRATLLNNLHNAKFQNYKQFGLNPKMQFYF